jgi:hypothetical protein
MKTLIAVLSCHALRHYEHEIRSTWGTQVPPEVDLRFFLGGSRQFPVSDEVCLNTPDNWEGITQKTVDILRWALEQGYEFIWKVDLDTLVRPKQLLSSGLERHDWVGGRNSFFASGGAGYGLSRRAMEMVVNRPIDTTCEEDVHTARAMMEHGVALHHDGRFKFCPGDHLHPEDLTMHLSSVRGWAVKYQAGWMQEAWQATGEYKPLGDPVAKRHIRFRRR